MIWAGRSIIVVSLALAACSDEPVEDPITEDPSLAELGDCQSPTSGTCLIASLDDSNRTCGMEGSDQVGCLTRAFELENCGDAVVIGQTHDGAPDLETYNHKVSFGLDNACKSELREAIISRGFRAGDKGEFVRKRSVNYREVLIFGLQISNTGSVVEWHRIQE